MTNPQQILFSMVKNLKAFPLGSGARHGCPLWLLLFSIVLEALATTIRREKEIKEYKLENKKQNTHSAYDMLLYIENPKDITRERLNLSMNLVNLQNTKLIHRNCLHSRTLTTKHQKEKLRGEISNTIATKRIKCII